MPDDASSEHVPRERYLRFRVLGRGHAPGLGNAALKFNDGSGSGH